MKYTKEEKKKYYKDLRDRWQKSKELSENDEELKALYNECGLNFSYKSFAFVYMQMKEQKLDGIPYIDCKTYLKWQDAGYQVTKGSNHKCQGITWLHPVDKNGEENEDMIYPKIYHLFHKSQVEEIKQ